jgi:simple sugar transport system permease protein
MNTDNQTTARASHWSHSLKSHTLALARPVAAAIIATLAVAAAMTLLGKNPVAVIGALVAGPLADRYRFVESLARACPLMLCGLAVAVAFRCQAWNIGVEGQYLAGAMAVAAVAIPAADWPAWALIPAMLIAAAAAGAAWALPAALLENRRHVPLVLSTILLNFVAVNLVRYLARGPLQGPDKSAPESALLAPQAHLQTLVPGTDFHWGFLLAVVIAVSLWVFMRWATAGFALRAVGLNPVAAEWAGIRVGRVKLAVMCLSGALGGLAGGMQVAGVHHLLRDDAAEGFGYVGIAVALLGGLNPIGVAVAAVALGMLDIGAMHLERQSALGVPSDVSQVIKGVLILTLLAAAGIRRVWVPHLFRGGGAKARSDGENRSNTSEEVGHPESASSPLSEPRTND